MRRRLLVRKESLGKASSRNAVFSQRVFRGVAGRIFVGVFVLLFVLASSQSIASKAGRVVHEGAVRDVRDVFDSGEVFRVMAKAVAERNPELAFALLRVAKENFPDDKRALNDFGVLAHQLGRTAEARDAFEAAVALDSSYERARYNLATLYNELGAFDLAAQQLSALVALNDASPNYWYDLAMNKAALLRQEPLPSVEGLDEVIEYLEKVRSLEPGFAKTEENLAVVRNLRAALARDGSSVSE